MALIGSGALFCPRASPLARRLWQVFSLCSWLCFSGCERSLELSASGNGLLFGKVHSTKWHQGARGGGGSLQSLAAELTGSVGREFPGELQVLSHNIQSTILIFNV